MGGNGPVGNSTIGLYVAGTTGYGMGATLLASTTTKTDGTGSFSIDPTSYTCPAGGQVYLTAKGGDPMGGSAASNAAIGLVASIGTCGSLAGFTNINESSTVATIYSAAQFFNATTEGFGSPSSVQAEQGLQNAFALAVALVPSATGNAPSTFTPASNVSGVTMTATPEQSKMNGIADILAACVNTTSSASATCSDLFNAAIGLPEASATSGSTITSGTFTKASDTMMAAYYLATNPSLLTSVTSQTYNSTADCKSDSDKAETSSACLLALIPASGAPFLTTLSTVPLDWTLSIAYSATGTCGNTGAPLSNVWHGAVDASGNVWMINDSNAGAANSVQANYSVLVELSPTGVLEQCLVGNLSNGQAVDGRDVTIDTAGNIWAASYGGSVYATSTSTTTTSYRNHVYQYIPGTSALNVEGGTAGFTSGLGAYYMTADGAGNVYILGQAVGGSLYEFPDAATDTGNSATYTAVGNNPINSSSTATQALYGIQADANNNIWISNEGSTTTDYVYTPSNATMSTVSAKNQTADYNLAIDANGSIVIANTCCASSNSNKAAKMIPGTTTLGAVTTGALSAQYAGGLSSARSIAIDGANNLWASSAVATNSAGYFNIVELDSALNGLSPTGTPTAISPATCPSTSCLTNGGFAKASLALSRGVAIDGSGDVWVFTSTGSNVTELIGAAVPVVTPLSIATKYNRLGQEPTGLSYSLPAETEAVGAVYNASVTFGINAPTPTGTITFTPVGTGAPICTLSSATTPFSGNVNCASSNSTLSVGTYMVKFTYSGDSNYGAASGMATLTVQ
jgi:hypothetical protein